MADSFRAISNDEPSADHVRSVGLSRGARVQDEGRSMHVSTRRQRIASLRVLQGRTSSYGLHPEHRLILGFRSS